METFIHLAAAMWLIGLVIALGLITTLAVFGRDAICFRCREHFQLSQRELWQTVAYGSELYPECPTCRKLAGDREFHDIEADSKIIRLKVEETQERGGVVNIKHR